MKSTPVMKSAHKNAVLYLVVLLIAVGVLGFFITSKSRQGGGQAMLFLTNPIYSVSGKVEKVEGDAITLTVTHQAPAPTGIQSPTELAGPAKTESMTFTVKVNGQTEYKAARGDAPVPYLFGDTQKQTGTVNKTVVPGQIITVESKTDLRALEGQTFTASVIYMPPNPNVMTGRVISVTDVSITVTAVNGQKTVAVTSATEISSMVNETPNKPPTPKRFRLDEIKPDGQVTIYTDKDVTGNEQLTALRIDPFMLFPGKESIVGGTQREPIPVKEAEKLTAPQPSAPTQQAVVPTLGTPTTKP